MNSLNYPDTSIAIDPLGPVNYLHPLNRGLVGWWLAMPGGRTGYGTGKWRDLTHNRNDGTLTNSGLEWQAQTHTGGKASLYMGGASDYVGIPSTVIGALPNVAVTISMWIYPNAVGNYENVFDATSGGASRQLSCFLGGAGGTYVAVAGVGGNGAANTYPWVANEWQYFLLTVSGSNVLVYRNGLLTATVASALGGPFTAAELQIGGNPSGGGTASSFRYDDIRINARNFTDAEAMALYMESLRGSPLTLRRTTIPLYVSGAAAASRRTELSVTATPGMVHTYTAKDPAATGNRRRRLLIGA